MKDMQKDTKRTAWMNWMMRLHRSPLLRLELSAVLTILILVICQTVSAAAEQRSLSEKMIRLHIVAQSDSAEDQALKLAVRDRLTNDWFSTLPALQSAQEAADYFAAHLDDLKAAAEDELRAHGCDRPVRVTLEREMFPVRHYASFSLPAGDYLALRVTIGDGAGKNWWCVMFPPMCTASAAKQMQQAEAVFSEGEWRMMTAKTPDVTIRFKLLEWWSQLKKCFSK